MTIPTALDSKHQAMLDRLDKASGTEFEAMYVQMQTTGHEEAVSLFSAYAKDGDQSALKAFAMETLPTLKEHLEHAKKLRTKTKSSFGPFLERGEALPHCALDPGPYGVRLVAAAKP